MSAAWVLRTYALVIAVASSIFMLWVFLNEAFFRRGVLYIEPNIAIATLEFFMVLLGIAILFPMMVASIGRTPTIAESVAELKKLRAQVQSLEDENDGLSAALVGRAPPEMYQ